MSGVKTDQYGQLSGISASTGNLRDLSIYLQQGAMLVFASCNAGQGIQGNQFLIKLSHELPHRVIVAFTIANAFSPWASDPGVLQEAPLNTLEKGTPRTSASGQYAKWAFEGKIVRMPFEEQNAFKRQKCINPKCPGHDKASERCPYNTWGH